MVNERRLDTATMKRLQRELAERVVEAPLPGPVRTVAGADVSFDQGSDTLYAAVVVLDAERLEILDVGRAVVQTTMPYVPGFLSFREAPGLLEAFDDLQITPDVLIVDGHGRAHPRRLGIASHVGVLLDVPTLGCAKKRLVGRYEPPGEEKGAESPLIDGEEVLGTVLRTRRRVKPVFVSVGHRITLEEARDLVLRLAPKYRLPEPTRAAHKEVNRMRIAAREE